ncbi:glycosyltransferase family 9 protein [Sunxiuqinia sp. A32]|uniref:glycosyltransferase family 9 protein n=1 Tax=Sunxiuqinia sp. A32 TaxID=3461496 RepID=UPI0040452607
MKTKILIIRFSSIGDIVLTSPIVRCIKQQLDDVEIHFLTKAKHQDLLIANPFIDHIHLLQENLSDIIPVLQEQKFDLIIDLHNNIRSQVVKQSIRAKSYTLNKINFRKWLLVQFKIDVMPNVHIVDRMMSTVSSLGVKNDLAGLDHFIPEEQEYSLSDLPAEFQNGYVAIVLAGTYFTKRLPAEKQIEIINKSKLPFILLGGKSEKKLADEISKSATSKVLNLCTKLSINQSASIVKQANLVIANDTGLMHIAAAFKKKILSVWGSTTPALGMFPYLPDAKSKMQKVDGLNCQPCSKIGRHQCPKKHFRCMHEQNSSEITNWIIRNF